MSFFRLLCGPPLLKYLGALDVVHCADDVDKEPFRIPTCPNGREDSRLVVNFYLESVRITLDLVSNFVVDKDIRNWWFLGVTPLNLLFTAAPLGPSSGRTWL